MNLGDGLDQQDSQMPSRGSFVLLRHELAVRQRAEAKSESSAESHWDLMLETDSGLLTWQIAELPQADASETLPNVLHAKRIADHRPLYLEYEGDISGNRGFVRRFAAGPFRCQPCDGPGRFRVELGSSRATDGTPKPAESLLGRIESTGMRLPAATHFPQDFIFPSVPVGSDAGFDVKSWRSLGVVTLPALELDSDSAGS
ncbi:MAG: hypothetical protein AAGG44_09065 [Planctomycetota bacterium]